MHIAEGVLAPTVLFGGAVLTAVGTALGLRRLDTDHLLITGVLASFFFIASLIHIPVGFTSAHLIGNGLVGILLGWAAFPAILVALFLQSLFFQFGGLTVLGVNTCTMALGALIAYYAFHGILRILPNTQGRKIASFAGGLLGVASSAFFTACALAGTDEGFLNAAMALFLAHIPIMLAEAVICMFTITFIWRVRPTLLHLELQTRTDNKKQSDK